MDGIAKAKESGVAFGRKPALTAEQRKRIRILREEEKFSVPQLADRSMSG
jgi:DNA invertase Pin-like site-specific DNA recombinase